MAPNFGGVVDVDGDIEYAASTTSFIHIFLVCSFNPRQISACLCVVYIFYAKLSQTIVGVESLESL